MGRPVTDAVIEARDVHLSRDGRSVLDGVSLGVDPGERVLVQGPSGSGKTTLFSVLGLLERPDSGEVVLGGEATTTLSERARARLRRETVGYVYQDFKLVADLTARENAALPQEHAGERDDAWLDWLFESLDVGDVGGQLPATLSGGEKQRVAAVRALANRPAVVLADEPTGQLDPAAADRLLDLLVSVQTDLDTALVVVSHDRSIVDRFDRTLTLAGGALDGGD